MDELVSRGHISQFQKPKSSLGDLGASVASAVIASSSDVAIVVDRKGVIHDLAFGSEEMSREGYQDWIGRRWEDTVTVDSRAKVREMLAEAEEGIATRWRQVNHPSESGVDVPVRYTALALEGAKRVVAMGRDLRAMAVLQQRVIEAQQAMERDYARLRQAETRYRLLFQITSEPVLIADATNLKIVESNPSAASLLGLEPSELDGRAVASVFARRSAGRLEELLARARARGRAEGIKIKLAGTRAPAVVSASVFRQDRGTYLLIQIQPESAAAASSARDPGPLAAVLDGLPDAFVVAGPDLRILAANPAFLELAQLATDDQAEGRALSDFIGRSGVELNVLIANMREHGSVRRFATVLRGVYGSLEEVEISAVPAPYHDTECFGFAIRVFAPRPTAEPDPSAELPRSVEQLTELVGRVSLKEIVRETTDLIERMCIEAALDLTSDNRASAAEILGLSRQSLYAKLHRHGLGNLASESGP